RYRADRRAVGGGTGDRRRTLGGSGAVSHLTVQRRLADRAGPGNLIRTRAPRRAASLRLAELEHVVVGFADGDISSAVFLALRERGGQGPDPLDPVLRVARIRIHFRRADEFEPRLLRQCNRVVLAHVPIL